MVGATQKIRAHYTFEQCKFKKDFIVMNLITCQNVQTDVEKDFHKLMNNAKFGYDCRNNADNCYFSPIYDEIDELSFAKRYQNIFDLDISDFASSEIPDRLTEEEYLNKIANLDLKDEYFDARKNSLEIDKKEKRNRLGLFNEKIKTKNTKK